MSVIDTTPAESTRVLRQTRYTVELTDGQTYFCEIAHRRGYDSTFAEAWLTTSDGERVDYSPQRLYLGYDCDTEIVAATTAHLEDPSRIGDDDVNIWMLFEGQIPECRCEDSEDDEDWDYAQILTEFAPTTEPSA